ncbi:hypothetical protein NECAME_05511 [Necator americanus]|uniref:Uncharacterized protein n=1 Tax=Necator americanus TaxID=51031 RepID=W2SIG5_NECAM|nr:hypothetical protein NECAME_05511 [Necator americanus]ETN68666.1 hypothetical protein NECAME_05511 [Necator americanus]
MGLKNGSSSGTGIGMQLVETVRNESQLENDFIPNVVLLKIFIADLVIRYSVVVPVEPATNVTNRSDRLGQNKTKVIKN